MELTSLDQVNQQYRQVYFQPHFDDAVLSCGGSIALQTGTGNRVLVVTVFGGIPAEGARVSAFASQTLQKMGLSTNPAESVRQRRSEDQAAVGSLGADVLRLDYLDAIFRGDPAYYQGDDALFGSVNPADLSLDEELGGVFLAIYERAPLAALYAPLGVGHHVDHQLCCSAADRLAQRKLNVKFYEDFPYVANSGALAARQRELNITMEAEMVEISGTVRQKEEAISLYRSQVPSLFGSEDTMIKTINSYSGSMRKAQPGILIERFWRW
ncbi:MAG TPA: PIG-L family deacetylase [Ktedonobacterales bacterium]|jgi:LmbE family N-acetylglucosaminyl deacetylase|nr:PIG-L family deacetylase [Ktedonobacterales bacterium]